MPSYSPDTPYTQPRALPWLRPLAISVAAVVLSGCFSTNTSQAPIATTYPYSEQQRMQAAHHWDVLANHQAESIVSQADTRFRDLYILPAADDMSSLQGGEFDRGFRDLLTSQLVSRGVRVVQAPHENSASVQVNVELVEHRANRFVRPPNGVLTALAGGIAVATYPINHWKEPALALLPLAAAADVSSGSWTSESNEEIIVTTQIIDDNQILYSSSNIYYTNQEDRRHYAPNQVVKPPAIPTISISDAW